MDGEDKKEKWTQQGGLRFLSEDLHAKYGYDILCPNCEEKSPDHRAYCKDEGGNGAEGEPKRRQWRCRNSKKRRKANGTGCPICSTTNYVKRAIAILGEGPVDQVRSDTLARLKSEGHETAQIEKRFVGSTTAGVSKTAGFAAKVRKLNQSVRVGIPALANQGHPQPSRTKRPATPSVAGGHSGERGRPGLSGDKGKRPRTTSPTAVEQRLQGIAAQITTLATQVRAVSTLLDTRLPAATEVANSTDEEREEDEIEEDEYEDEGSPLAYESA